MKKILSMIIAAVSAVTLAFGFSACGESNEDPISVNLMSVAPTDVGSVEGVDYYVVPEPMASLKCKVMGLNVVGNIQELYSANSTFSGYPQAVIVAKTSLLESNSQFVSSFVKVLSNNKDWLMEDATTIEDITTAISSHLPNGTTPTFDAKNLTKQVISNCDINFISAKTDEQRIRLYISELGEINPDAVGELSNDFFYEFPSTLSSSAISSVSVYMPDGAPALALAQMMSEYATIDDVEINYNVVVAETIASYVTGDSSKADICVLPSNLASKKLGNGSEYKLLGTVTHGNLYVLSSNTTENLTIENLSTLNGKTVGVVNLANVPGLTFKSILKKNNISYNENGLL